METNEEMEPSGAFWEALGTHSWTELLSPSVLLIGAVKHPKHQCREGCMDTEDFTQSSALCCNAFHPKETFCLLQGPSASSPALRTLP